MFSVLLAIHFVITILLCIVILVQQNDGSDLGLDSGYNKVYTEKRSPITHATSILATIFICNCLIMTWIVRTNKEELSLSHSAKVENISQDKKET